MGKFSLQFNIHQNRVFFFEKLQPGVLSCQINENAFLGLRNFYYLIPFQQLAGFTKPREIDDGGGSLIFLD